MNNFKMVRAFLLVAVVIPFTGCYGTMVPGGVATGTPGIIIEGDDFRINEGQPAPLPFVLSHRLLTKGVIDEYDDYRDRGARDVRVHVPGMQEPLYGLLSLHELPGGSSGPARRSLSIRVPSRYIEAAMDGNVSVVYEPVEGPNPNCFLPASWCKMTWFGWVLWLSDRPF